MCRMHYGYIHRVDATPLLQEDRNLSGVVRLVWLSSHNVHTRKASRNTYTTERETEIDRRVWVCERISFVISARNTSGERSRVGARWYRCVTSMCTHWRIKRACNTVIFARFDAIKRPCCSVLTSPFPSLRARYSRSVGPSRRCACIEISSEIAALDSGECRLLLSKKGNLRRVRGWSREHDIRCDNSLYSAFEGTLCNSDVSAFEIYTRVSFTLLVCH